jgi:hypothetical protein
MHAYLAKLPGAENSYPQNRMRAGLVNICFDHQPLPLTDDMPDWLRSFASTREPATAMLSYVKFNAWVLALLDTVWMGKQSEYVRFNYEVNRKFGEAPMYSFLYKLLSPGFVARHLPMALGQLMPGLDVRVKAEEGRAQIALGFPAHLLDDTLTLGWAAAFRAMTENAGGRDVRCERVALDEQHADFEVRWTRARNSTPSRPT